MLTKTEQPSGSSTICTISGDPLFVGAEIIQYFSNYDPAGYDTRITNDTTAADGVRTVKITRYNSCD